MDAKVMQDEPHLGGRRNRVVLASRRWGQVRSKLLKSGPAGDGSKKARFPGRSRISRNTVAQGRPVVRLILW